MKQSGGSEQTTGRCAPSEACLLGHQIVTNMEMTTKRQNSDQTEFKEVLTHIQTGDTTPENA